MYPLYLGLFFYITAHKGIIIQRNVCRRPKNRSAKKYLKPTSQDTEFLPIFISRYYGQQPYVARTRKSCKILKNTFFVAEACLRHITYQKFSPKHSRTIGRKVFLILFNVLTHM